jgi:hypothetical protein
MKSMSPPIPFVHPKKSPGRREAVGALYQQYYLDVVGAVEDFLCFLLLLCLWDLAAGALVPVSAAMGAADFGMSAAMEAAVKPKLNNATVIKVTGLFMRAPNGDMTQSAAQVTLKCVRLGRDEDHFTLMEDYPDSRLGALS